MTPEECARFVLSDCRDPELRAKADREAQEEFDKWLAVPENKAAWQAHIGAFAARIDYEILKSLGLTKPTAQ